MEETEMHMGRWEEPIWKDYTFQLRDTLENCGDWFLKKPAVARRREGGMNRWSAWDV